MSMARLLLCIVVVLDSKVMAKDKTITISPLRVREVCGYDPVRDISPVSPDDSLDLHEAFISGFVPNEAAISDSDYQNVDDPKSIIGRPANEFEAIHMVQTLKSYHDEAAGSSTESVTEVK